MFDRTNVLYHYNTSSCYFVSSAVGGELFDQLTKDVTFSEKRARFVYLHYM